MSNVIVVDSRKSFFNKLGYDIPYICEKDGCYILKDSDIGTITPRNIALKIINEIKRTYDEITDEEIEDFNERKLEYEADELYRCNCQEGRSTKPGFVYFLRNKNFTKIGRTQNIKSRLKSLNVNSPEEIVLIATYKTKDSERLEALIHSHFNHFRSKGEWFCLQDKHLEKIKNKKYNSKEIQDLIEEVSVQ
jgi:hypothetical protein